MLPQAVALHDIDDAEAFVRANIKRSGVLLTQDEREELVAEGLVILCDMATKFIKRMDGYDRDGSFAGYASRFLPKRMKEAYHGLHPEHVQRTDSRGKKFYEYGQAPGHLPAGPEQGRVRQLGDFVPVPVAATA